METSLSYFTKNFIICHFLSFIINIGCSFKFLLNVGVEELIVNAPRVTDDESAV
jgi:hypothetical protein